MSFGYSGKKDDVSMKLRAQNMKNARKQTSQLELDNRKMEDRLQELKLAMMHEKEERDMNLGGGFWKTGQEGNLGSYAKDVLNKPLKAEKNKEKKKKVKVLKDEPIVTSERNTRPGTMKFIADRRSSGKENKIKGSVCGQCEEKAAHVSCLECGEDYCASCFAAFHMKGALKKHRSVPVGATGSRTPRAMATMSGDNINNQTPHAPPYDESLRATPTDVNLIMDYSRSSARSSARSSIPSARHSSTLQPQPPPQQKPSPTATTNSQPSLLDGNYDEGEAAAEFQRALAEWRTGKKTAVKSGTPVKKMSPATASVYSTDEGTGTETIDQSPVDIKFHGTLTYAEKLMLKKYRRHQLGSVSSPSSSSYQDYSSSSSRMDTDPAYLADLQEERPNIFSEVEVINQDALDADIAASRVDIGSLLSSVKRPHDDYIQEADRSESRVSIIEVNNVSRRSIRGLENTSEYEVTEITDGEIFRPPTPSALATAKSNKLWETKEAFRTPQSSAKLPRTKPEVQTPKSGRNKPVHSSSNIDITSSVDNSRKLSARGSSNVRRSKGAMDIRNDPTEAISSQQLVDRPPPPNSARGKSGTKSRPQSRAKSRNNNERPQSRAKSRAESRLSIFGEGVLTKEPSPALKEIADLASHLTSQIVYNTEYRLGLGDFFTAGVDEPVEEEVERTLTPTRNRPMSARRPKSAAAQKQGDIEKWKISNKLYSMTPRSWKPDFSLADTISDSQAQDHVKDTEVQNLDRLAEESMMQEIATENSEEVFASVDRGVKSLQAAMNMEKESKSQSSRKQKSAKSMSNTGRNTPVRPPSRPHTASGRESRLIVMEGEDLSLYDHVEEKNDTVQDDIETLDQLEWELASETGRITADGRISRMLDEDDTAMQSDSFNNEQPTYKPSKDRGIDIQNHLRESELMDDFEEMEATIMSEEEVKRLV